MTLLYTDPLFLEHDTGPHPENANRLRSISAKLTAAGLIEKCVAGTYRPVTPEVVAQLHSAKLVQAARTLAEHGGGRLDPDTVVSAKSYDVALAAVGAGVAAVEAVLTGKEKTALCLVRPPGHHATPERSMGFCLFNNIALAANHARTAHKLDRILIVDWDVHHGNGTQDVFYSAGDVFFLSIHRFGRGFYPGTGDKDETGAGNGLGRTLNVPIAFGTPRKEFHAAFRSALEKAADAIKPQLVLISAGFDAHREDPIGSLGLEVEDFGTLTREVLAVAKTHAQGRVVSCLEGGYNRDRLAESVQLHLEELLAFK
jgi:acetoin utilization deacetylase AcuC-like enzyme